MNIEKPITLAAVLCGAIALLQGCSFFAGAATGAAAGEVLEEEGYDIESPIQKEEDDD